MKLHLLPEVSQALHCAAKTRTAAAAKLWEHVQHFQVLIHHSVTKGGSETVSGYPEPDDLSPLWRADSSIKERFSKFTHKFPAEPACGRSAETFLESNFCFFNLELELQNCRQEHWRSIGWREQHQAGCLNWSLY